MYSRNSFIPLSAHKMLRCTPCKSLLVLILLGTIFVISAKAALYNSKLVNKFQGSTQDAFFGYSVALQQGTPPRVVIGAPKSGPNKVGSVYVCLFNESEAITSDQNCKSYTIDNRRITNTLSILFQDNMFGACVDGGIDKNDEILVGSPKLTEKRPDLYYMLGGVFKLSDLEKNIYRRYPENIHEGQFTQKGQYFYGNAQFGFSLHSVNSKESLYGTPGFGHWRGEAFRSYESDGNVVPEARRAKYRNKREAFERNERFMKLIEDDSSLAGYAVTSGQFFGHTSYVVGLPNGKSMMGEVKLYYNHKGEILEEHPSWPNYEYRQMAEHFGSALAAADVNGDGFDDLLVGAPNANLDAYDQGKVYVFISNRHSGFELHQTLVGLPQSRFGTAITNLGKITLDNHESVAIGAPYENKNLGAVRVYVWTDSKLTLDSKVSIREFPSFGYSLSRPVDVDHNNVADLAVGAYKSEAIAILKAKSVFYYNISMTYNTLNAGEDDTNLPVTICIFVEGIKEHIATDINLEFDDRFKRNSGQSSETSSIANGQPYCKTHSMELAPNIVRLDPLSVIIRLQEKTCDNCPVRSPTYPSIFRKKIPFNYNCKSDICIPIISITSDVVKSLVVGPQAKYDLLVHATNTGDPTFVCKIEVTAGLPISITPVNPMRCTNTACEFNHIISSVSQAYTLHFDSWSRYDTYLDLDISTYCVNSTTNSSVTIKLNYESKQLIVGSNLTKQYDSINASTYNIEGATIFHVFNEGPSNLQSASYIIRIPRISHDVQIIDIFKPDDDQLCSPVDAMFDVRTEYNTTVFASEPTTAGFGQAATLENTISCVNPRVECLEIRCVVMDLHVNDTKVLKIPTRVNITEILKNYRSTFSIESTITREDNEEKTTSEFDIIDKQTIIESLNVWIIIGSILGALLLLVVVIFVMYKLNFFNRPMHELLQEQQEMEGTTEEVELRKPALGGPSTDVEELVETSDKN